MKKLSLTTLLIIITLGFSSCSQDDNTFLEDTSSENLLKSFNVNKSASGEFTLNYELGKGAASDDELDLKTNTNNIYLYLSDDQAQSSRKSQGLTMQEGRLKVNFNDTDKGKNHIITILDSDIQMKSGGNEFLESYDVIGNGDGTYDLDFKVKDGVAVEYIFNDDTKVYEIHLNNDASASETDFVQTFTKQEGVALNIQFFDNSSAYSKTSSSYMAEGEPVVIIED
jgi:hypothetical protein